MMTDRDPARSLTTILAMLAGFSLAMMLFV
jgi:hypothetical protein